MTQMNLFGNKDREQSKTYTLEELMTQVNDIYRRGFITSVYIHAGGIGNTFETLLHVTENNISLPDWGTFELKARRKETGSMITLFTKSPNRYNNAQLLNDYGYISGGSLKIHQTVYFGSQNAQGFILKKDKYELQCWNKNDCLGTYSLEFLKSKFIEKVGDGVILALAKTRLRSDGWEEFHYQDVFLLRDSNFEELIANLRYDIRIGRYPDGRVHDHGSAFRLRFADLEKVFHVYRKLL